MSGMTKKDRKRIKDEYGRGNIGCIALLLVRRQNERESTEMVSECYKEWGNESGKSGDENKRWRKKRWLDKIENTKTVDMCVRDVHKGYGR